MKRTKEKDALTLTHSQLEELREKIFSLLHARNVSNEDIETICKILRRILFQLKSNSGAAAKQFKNGVLDF